MGGAMNIVNRCGTIALRGDVPERRSSSCIRILVRIVGDECDIDIIVRGNGHNGHGRHPAGGIC